MKTFKVPEFYRSPIISKIKQFRKIQDPRKRDNSPTILDFGSVKYYVARHFGFCYGVENAIEIAFRALEENPGKRIFLLSEMIHNPEVNKDLTERGVRFLQDTHGKQLISFDVLTNDDIVMIPAFGAPLPLLSLLSEKGIKTESYNTTCPFVERVWKKSEQIGKSKHTIIIHGKNTHEETRSTFSRSAIDSEAVVIVRDMRDAEKLKPYVLGKKSQKEFEKEFEGKFTKGFDINKHFEKLGVINQTTMLATETQGISDFFKEVMVQKFGSETISDHYADTRDTLCYATNENQDATYGLLETDADLAIIVGGYNSSNTSHLVELCERKFPSYFISSSAEIVDKETIKHYDYSKKSILTTKNFLPNKKNIKIIITSGASCPDSLLEGIIHKLNTFFEEVKPLEEVLKHLEPA
ncbi:4-hydroxy-3-methylbut-2-enyl diphosphate reductase [Aurantibacillus circumpalustris]|uniref:4-hydroxy-3-methylbut-2-enyl diphosphate reductase n=1 Tax=Aurantibacillus circumpalustris TaxID=3036359 RepID=UPI00295B0E33|nr:4-hydroxy-3-methylbut-2-enyl diphosphate reductase [Aurantibacillus circumpalustris]